MPLKTFRQFITDIYVEKNELSQPRVDFGSRSQDEVVLEVRRIAQRIGLNISNEYEIAPPRSDKPDLIMTIENQPIQFEIKGTDNRIAPITVFDKSVARGRKIPKELNNFASMYIKTLFIGEDRLDQLMRNKGIPFTFIGLIDFFKGKNPRIGLAGDPGVSKSGYLPLEFNITDRTLLAKVRRKILNHFRESKDDYFVIHTRQTNEFEFYFVGKDESKNILNARKLPKLKWFTLATSGGVSKGATRVGFKIKI